MNFEQLLESEMSVLEERASKKFSGTVDAFSQRNAYEAIPMPSNEWIISVDNQGGHEGVIEVHPSQVIYKDHRGNIVHRESMSKPVNKRAVENHYIPTLMTHTRSDDMFESECEECNVDLIEESAEYNGKKVTLNKPFKNTGGKKKFAVYVRNDKGNVVKVQFGDPNMTIKRDDPARRKAFRARHGCDNPGPKWKAKFWSCKSWSDSADWV